MNRGSLDEFLAIGKLVDAMKADPSEIERNRAEKESQRARYREKFPEMEIRRGEEVRKMPKSLL
jgi:hypothetical protein